MNIDNLWIKCLQGDRATYTGTCWPMPTGEPDADGWTIGPWTPRRRPALCASGWHVLADAAQLLRWGLHQDVWLAEVRGESVIGHDKAAWEQARLVWRCPWDDTARRLFGADCAERVLPVFEKQYPGDDRPRRAIEAARAFARGEIGRDELRAAAYATTTTDDAAAAAAYAAARQEERRWQADRLAWYLGLKP